MDDRVFGTYSDGIVGPGFMVQLSHTETPVVTELMWMPISSGSLVLSMVIGSTLGAVVYFLPRRQKRGRPAAYRASLIVV